ncbi:MAG: hypothetical protein AB8H12_15435 [Lewinella sp.]
MPVRRGRRCKGKDLEAVPPGRSCLRQLVDAALRVRDLVVVYGNNENIGVNPDATRDGPPGLGCWW